ncbi:MAG: diacylglycerol kinase [Candidatus Eremiobacter antarcticus]|nr:diacylglycerol kinase family protein [Candidatus Eremiobacteraeota bacterium]MBC5809202.1 diacylglycerol kinase family protein [Candidatus Eremiobacteraeota bacterium]PZR61757.1 MAG: diacylglycerol kinase [Candidatus Eremiobacter sp. RRmetagenome_bin22]
MPERTLADAFSDAADGVASAIKGQPNFRIQLAMGAGAVVLAALLHFGVFQWIILSLIIGFVLAAELVNTCLEHVVDLIMPDSHPLARSAKHAGAGAVLLVSITAAVTGAILYAQALREWLAAR